MVTLTKRPKTVDTNPISRGKYWSYLNNLTKVDGVAQCDEVETKTATMNKPQPVILKNFDLNIPTNAVIKKVKLSFEDRFVSYVSDVEEKYFPVFSATKVSWNGANIDYEVVSAPQISFMKHSHEFVIRGVTPTDLNDADFGVVIEHSYNASNDNYGGVYLKNVILEVEYDIPRFNVSITEPRHKGASKTWSTEDDPTILKVGERCSTTIYLRSVNGLNAGEQTVRIEIPINYQLLELTPVEGRLQYYVDKPYVDWIVTPSYDASKGLPKASACNITFTPRAFNSTELIKATNQYDGVFANYFVSVDTDFDFSDDVRIYTKQLSRLVQEDDAQPLQINLNIDVPLDMISEHNLTYPFSLQLFSLEEQEYVPFTLRYLNEDRMVRAYTSDPNIQAFFTASRNYKKYHVDVDLQYVENYTGVLKTDLTVLVYGLDLPMGEYEFHAYVPHFNVEDESTWDLYSQNVYIDHEPYAIGYCSAERWVINTPNMATQTEDGGYAFECRVTNGFQWKSRMEGNQAVLEQRHRHIGGLRLPKSHYEPKLKFSNKVNKGLYKNRAYYNKTGQWEHDLTLNIYLPKFHWRTLMEFVKMDKPVAIDTCPTCDDDDVLNHRGWVEIEEISNVERVNNWWYKGEIGVQRITDKYYGKANIVKGARVCNAQIPYNFMQLVDFGQYYLGYFRLIGGGQLIYDKEQNILNQVIVPTGENLHIRSRWASKDIDDYKFSWRQVLPSEATDESNDFKNNAIIYNILDNATGNTLLSYTLYDFTTFDEIGNIVNTCKVSCTTFDKDNTPTLLFQKQLRMDYDENDPTEYWSTTRMQFNADMVTISETGVTGQELMERNIPLVSGEYLLDICFANNDVGLIEPDFITYFNMDLKENVMANPLSNYYQNLLVSTFVIPNLKLQFYRYSKDGMIYYYTGDTTASYVVDGFEQYKGGVDLQTPSGASILYVDNYTQTLMLSNGLCKIGFDRTYGLIMFYVYDAREDEYIYVNMLKLDDWSDFDILSITDDKAVVQFGETIWTMWKGHPFIQCEHINTDLKINDEYNTINSEAIITTDGQVVYDGSYGKKENYLFDMLVTPVITVTGTNSPHFISGDTVTLRCYLKDKYNEYITNTYYSDANDIGKVNFIVNDKSLKVDPTPSADAHGRWYWEYSYVPPAKTDSYQAYARFIPVGHFTEGSSNFVKYDVKKLDTRMYVIGDSTVKLSDETYTVKFRLQDYDNAYVKNQPVEVWEKTLGGLAEIYTDNNGLVTYVHDLTEEGVLEFYAKFKGSARYNACTSPVRTVIVEDDTKTDPPFNEFVTIGDYGEVDFYYESGTGVDVKLTIDGRTYRFPTDTTKTIWFDGVGTYPYVAEYLGNAEYNKARIEGTLTLSKSDTALIFSPIGGYTTRNLGEDIQFSAEGGFDKMPYILYDNDNPVKRGELTAVGHESTTITYKPTYAGSHVFKLVFKGDEWRNGCEEILDEIMFRNSVTHMVHSNGEIYKGCKDYVRLLDSDNTPIVGRTIRYTVNGKTYNRVTNEQGYAGMDINLNQGQYPIHVAFMGDEGYTTSYLDYTLTVKGYAVQWKPARSFVGEHGSKTAPYQIWNNLGFDGLDGTGYCTCGYSTNVNEVISARNGTYNTADKLYLGNYGFAIPQGATIKEVKVRIYERQYDPLSNSMPNIGNAVITMAGREPRTCPSAPLRSSTGWNVNEVTWTDAKVTPSEINRSEFALLVEHGANTGSTTGCLMMKYFEIGVFYAIETVKE